MILGPVSLIDCAVFCVFLAPQLILHIGLFRTIYFALRALPFLVLRMPASLAKERFILRRDQRSPFVARATLFEDLVIRCVRYAFAEIPANVGRVFFSKAVALPFLRWRMARHGFVRSPVTWKEYKQEGPDGFRGIWISADPSMVPDMVLYYVHGGGFAMGSTYFYLEFLLAWHALLCKAGYRNPAIFALEYSLVPDQTYPAQVHETLRGYRHVLSAVGDPAKVVVGGDSAGGTLVLTMLLELGQLSSARACKKKFEQEVPNSERQQYWRSAYETPLPGLAVLISPWVTLISDKHDNSTSDYLDKYQLHEYAMQYAGRDHISDHTASPGLCTDRQLWANASPRCGFFVMYGSEEVFAPEIKEFIKTAVRSAEVDSRKETGGIHAWPVASLFLSSAEEQRLRGLRTLTVSIRKHIL
ncbi:hypothetical protein D7B24_001898 [Verticillium nonalfalfae]|uniref:Alpha/beta hydrolase fold-3 domain-containing protein n=1 Tax=Verticillium nonalfalfae TaxID=1051616 RepID=A0A3M9Y093_9PEZI|nr:uncharacterized protein D7B24_001898 [Verticillium nonalfalfae]RNJ53462.1 hypothetical protein D7B24_001898 [Verticillium nonalfalfae]